MPLDLDDPGLEARLRDAGVSRVYEPMVALLAAEAVSPAWLLQDVRKIAAFQLRTAGSAVASTWELVSSSRPPSLIAALERGGLLGFRLPLSHGAWATCGAGSLHVTVPVGYPETVCEAAVERLLDAVFEVRQLKDRSYRVAAMRSDGPVVRVRCEVAILPLADALVQARTERASRRSSATPVADDGLPSRGGKAQPASTRRRRGDTYRSPVGRPVGT